MPTIKRVTTIVSLYQEEGKSESCGKDCLGACCIAGAKMPSYSFARASHIKPKRIRSFGDFHSLADSFASSDSSSDSSEPEKSFFDMHLTSEWEERVERGLFRYDVTACETKEIEGAYGFIAQLNEGRHLKKRPTEFRIDQVLQDFDPNKFNFTKVGQEEVLFCFEESEVNQSFFSWSSDLKSSPNVVVINVSPIEYGHVLLVPRVRDCLPQRIQADTLILALQMAMEADNPYFRLGYNSLGAFATINQLHFQAYYLQAAFPIEKAPTRVIRHKNRHGGIKVSELEEYPVRALVYELGNSLDEVAAAVAAGCQALEQRNVPFNLLIADRGARVFLIPQCFAAKQARNEVPLDILECQVNPAAWEISGHIVLKRKQDYEDITEQSVLRLLSQVSLSQTEFIEVTEICLEAADKTMVKALQRLQLSNGQLVPATFEEEWDIAHAQREKADAQKICVFDSLDSMV